MFAVSQHRSGPCIVVSPELRIEGVCCIGLSSHGSLQVHNPSNRWQCVLLTITHFSINSHNEDQNISPFVVKSKVTIDPNSTASVKVLLLVSYMSFAAYRSWTFSNDIFNLIFLVGVCLKLYCNSIWLLVNTVQQCPSTCTIHQFKCCVSSSSSLFYAKFSMLRQTPPFVTIQGSSLMILNN